MYERKKIYYILGASIIVFALFFFFIRNQTAISDKEFLRSMIPHHASALLMCNKAQIQDQEIKELCQVILSSQQEQIDQMKRRLNELGKK